MSLLSESFFQQLLLSLFWLAESEQSIFEISACDVTFVQYIWVIDQAWGQDGWILDKFFFCVFMDRYEVEVHKHAKKERGQYPAILTEQAWSIKDLLYGIKHQNMINFPCGTKPVSRAGKIELSCPLGVANHSGRSSSSCTLAELSYNKYPE